MKFKKGDIIDYSNSYGLITDVFTDDTSEEVYEIYWLFNGKDELSEDGFFGNMPYHNTVDFIDAICKKVTDKKMIDKILGRLMVIGL